jgi:hypothetical protein
MYNNIVSIPRAKIQYRGSTILVLTVENKWVRGVGGGGLIINSHTFFFGGGGWESLDSKTKEDGQVWNAAGDSV